VGQRGKVLWKRFKEHLKSKKKQHQFKLRLKHTEEKAHTWGNRKHSGPIKRHEQTRTYEYYRKIAHT
jgi:hypothetical protein